MRKYPERPLGDVIHLDIDKVSVSPNSTYEIAGVYSFGRGLFSRGPIQGSQTSYTNLHRLHEGSIVLSRLKAFEGAVSLVNKEFDGCFLSPEFPTFSASTDTDSRYIGFLCQWPDFWKSLSKGSKGLGARRERVNTKQLLEIKAPLPDLIEQRRIVGKLNALEHRISDVRSGHENARTLRAALRRALIEEALDSDSRQTQVGDLISLIRRPVNVVADQLYLEIGLRSFGKGVFHKPPVSGESIANKKVFHIEPGDLLFSNVFAWEGAAAIASKQEKGFIGSHRFMTYRVNEQIADPTYLLHYFCHGPGIEAVRAASPGSAGRNRTLGIKAFASHTLTLPCLDKQKHIAKQLSRLVQAEQAAEAQATELSALSTSILNAAFTGQL